MKPYKHKSTDLETEPDYPVTLTCKECGYKQTVSGQELESLEINIKKKLKNYLCADCDPFDTQI